MRSALNLPQTTPVHVVMLALAMVACEGSTDSARTFPNGAPSCAWEGWYVSPWSECEQLCLPDNPEKRIPILRWVSAEDVCSSCTKLEMPNATDWLWDFYAIGQPDYMTLAYMIPVEGKRELYTEAWLVSDAGGRVLYAHRPGTSTCDHPMAGPMAHGPILSDDGSAAILYMYSDYAVSQVLNVDRISEFGITMSGRFTWPGAVRYNNGRGTGRGGRFPLLVSAEVLVVDPALSGDALIGDLRTMSVTSFGDLTGAAGGASAYSDKLAVASDIVFTRRSEYRNGPSLPVPEYWVGQGDEARWMGNDLGLATDGKTMVYARDGNVYASLFTTDTASLVPRLLFANFPDYVDGHDHILANGWVASLFHVRDIETGLLSDSWIVAIRIEDGATYRMAAPSSAQGRLVFFRAYPGESELWAAAEDMTTNTILRIPYSSMTMIQAHAPEM
jgi:hypothetical protein